MPVGEFERQILGLSALADKNLAVLDHVVRHRRGPFRGHVGDNPIAMRAKARVRSAIPVAFIVTIAQFAA
jgi:hypothetical protein